MTASLRQLQEQADVIARDAEIFGRGDWTTDAARAVAAARLHRNTEILLAWARDRNDATAEPVRPYSRADLIGHTE